MAMEKVKKENSIYMLIISIIYILINFSFGFFCGFARSPYNHDILAILKNVIVKILPIIGIELARAVLINKNRNNKRNLIIITILFILLEINYHAMINAYKDKQDFFEYVCKSLIPLVMYSCLYTYLTAKCSCLLPIIFRSIKQISILILPILPNMDWFMQGSIEAISVTIIAILFQYSFGKNVKTNKLLGASHLIVILISILLVCFMLGMFKYEPITILSNSMEPAFERADVVIYKKIDEKQLGEIPIGSIIIYSTDGKNIAHRIVDKINENGIIQYQTKGDRNNMADRDLVQVEQIKGVYVFHIKYIGFPSVWLYEYFHI